MANLIHVIILIDEFAKLLDLESFGSLSLVNRSLNRGLHSSLRTIAFVTLSKESIEPEEINRLVKILVNGDHIAIINEILPRVNILLVFYHSIKYKKHAIIANLPEIYINKQVSNEFTMWMLINNVKYDIERDHPIEFLALESVKENVIETFDKIHKYKYIVLKVINLACDYNYIHIIEKIVDSYQYAIVLGIRDLSKVAKIGNLLLFKKLAEKVDSREEIIRRILEFNDVELLKEYNLQETHCIFYEELLLIAFKIKNIEIMNYLLRKTWQFKMRNIRIQKIEDFNEGFLAELFKRFYHLHKSGEFYKTVMKIGCPIITNYMVNNYPDFLAKIQRNEGNVSDNYQKNVGLESRLKSEWRRLIHRNDVDEIKRDLPTTGKYSQVIYESLLYDENSEKIGIFLNSLFNKATNSDRSDWINKACRDKKLKVYKILYDNGARCYHSSLSCLGDEL